MIRNHCAFRPFRQLDASALPEIGHPNRLRPLGQWVLMQINEHHYTVRNTETTHCHSWLLTGASLMKRFCLALASEGQRSQLPVLNPEPHLAGSEATRESISP